MTVGILVVSHSAAIATGTVELARQMAADVPMVAAGGTDDGGIGTSFEAIADGIQELAPADAVVVLCDLGSAYLTTDTALDFLDEADRDRVHVSQAPLVEGTVAAAVAAQTGGDVDAVLAAASSAARSADDDESASDPTGDRPGGTAPVDDADPTDGAVTETVELVNESGPARPARGRVREGRREARVARPRQRRRREEPPRDHGARPAEGRDRDDRGGRTRRTGRRRHPRRARPLRLRRVTSAAARAEGAGAAEVLSVRVSRTPAAP